MSRPGSGGRAAPLGRAVALNVASRPWQRRWHLGAAGIAVKSRVQRRSGRYGRRTLTTQWSRRREYHRVKDLMNERAAAHRER